MATSAPAALRLQGSLKETLYWFLHPRSRVLEIEGFHHVEMIARQLAAGYASLALVPAPTEIAIDVPPWSAPSTDSDFLGPVQAFQSMCESELKPYLAHALLHGSLATLDYSPGWSDFDTYLVVSRETCLDANRLVELRRLLQASYPRLTELDPHQHHGFLVCSELDFVDYPSYFMPIEVLRMARSLDGAATRIRLRPRPFDRNSALERFRSQVVFLERCVQAGAFLTHALNGEYLREDFVNRSTTFYQMKNFLEFILILPAYFQEALGKPCYKRDSFERTRPELAEPEWEILDRASRIRAEWPSREKHPYASHEVPAWIVQELGPGYLARTLKLARALMLRLEQHGR